MSTWCCAWFGLNDPKRALDSAGKVSENYVMEIRGRVQNGVVVPEGDVLLPEGAMVTVSCPGPLAVGPPKSCRRVYLPLVRSDRPGSRRLTAERIAEILEDDDVSP